MANEHIMYDGCITIYDIDRYFFDDEALEKMNNHLIQKNVNAYFDYPHIGGGAQDSFHQMIIIAIEIFRNIGSNAIYDIIKYTLSTIWNKIENSKDKPTLYIECNNLHIELDYGFDLTDEQKDMVIEKSLNFIQENIKSID